MNKIEKAVFGYTGIMGLFYLTILLDNYIYDNTNLDDLTAFVIAVLIILVIGLMISLIYRTYNAIKVTRMYTPRHAAKKH